MKLTMRDATAQTGPLTVGQQIVARWETDMTLAEPCELAQLIDDAIAAEREACARVAENACLVPPDGGSPTEDEARMCADAARYIRGRGEQFRLEL